MSNIILSLPLPNKSADLNDCNMSPGSDQSALFIICNHILNELLLLAFLAAKSSIDFRFISLTLMYDVKLINLHKK